jgi:RNA polymerase sigma-70 factor (ECF subfamily)
LDTNTERILLEEIKSNQQKFGVLYDVYYDQIFSYIFRRLGDYELARDIAASTFLKAYVKIHAFEWKGVSIAYWFFRIATNEVNLCFRNKKYISFLSLHAIDDNIQSADFAKAGMAGTEREMIENEMKQHEEFAAVLTALKKLKTTYQEVIALKYFEQKSIAEIAMILHKKEGTVKSLLSRGIEKLKKLL